ncbi:MAG TPA: ethylbenzene dehydrogenase-related protein, partial [Candidatus Krumholzibacteria bacterium]|nr:ethylbenzene dehydrogenase-related protein [Candidatus Krumholzibacteria bacterium]
GRYMSTNHYGEKADTWHWKRDRNGPVYELDDQWLDDALNGRHNDAGTGSYSDNVQSLVTTSMGTKTLPKYWIPGRTNYHWIMQSEIDNGTARKIVDMDADGNLIDEDGTVLDKTQFGYSSALVIPSVHGIQPATGSRGDVDAWYRWENGHWYLKVKRLRDTGNDDDVQFAKRNHPYEFSIGIMNAASIAHATPGGWSGLAYRLILE